MKYKGLTLLHNIGTANHSNYHTLEKVKNSTDPLGFDGIYYNVYENQQVLEGKTGIFFVMGNYVGKDNTFDLPNVPKLEKYCTWEHVEEMCDKYDFEIGWHTYSHPDLTTLSKEEILKEITPPKPMKYFAYPYGRFNDLAIECVKEVGFEYAWSVTQGCTDESDPDYRFKIFRNYL
jgi:hypothetical protein